MRNEMSLCVPAAMTKFIKFITDPLRLEQASPTDYAEHVDSMSPSVSPIILPRTLGRLRMSWVIFLRFAAPLLIALRVDYSGTMIPQVLCGGGSTSLLVYHRVGSRR